MKYQKTKNGNSVLLELMFSERMWQQMFIVAEEKGLSRKLLKELSNPNERVILFSIISKNEYCIFPPHVSLIPKDNGEYREVYINSDRDRIILSLINECLMELFADMIHPRCKSYQKGIGTQEIVAEVSKEIQKIKKRIKGYKCDYSKYFDTVTLKAIFDVFDQIENDLGFEIGTEPVINLLRRYYSQDIYFDNKGNPKLRFQSLKQGCAVASFLADVILYEVDEFMSNKYEYYVRYSDDSLILGNNTRDVINDMNRIVSKYGVKLNPKKVEPIFKNKWFKFLGFSIKEDLISLSKSRIKNFQNEIMHRSIQKNYSSSQARRAIIKYLYEGEYSWASSCLGIINCKSDLDKMNAFIMDCIRACETKKKKVGGLGYNPHADGVIQRGKGKNVKSNKQKTEKEIEHYLSMDCLSKIYKINKSVYRTVIENM